MKNKRIYIFTTIFVFIFTFIMYQSFDKNSLASTDTGEQVAKQKKYYFIRRNMLSHHYITGNYDPSGTIMIKTGSTTSVNGERVITYCANKGKYIAKSTEGKYYVNVPISETSVSKIKKAQNNLTGVMLNSYPYISLSELKARIKTSIGEEAYNKYEFDTLDAQEAMTATQAAVWNAIDKTDSNSYRTTAKIGKIHYANFHKGTSNSSWGINWDTQAAYNITSGCYKGTGSNLDCGSKSTYLAEGDTAASTGTYKAKGTNNLKARINKLISWYGTLTKENTTSLVSLPSFNSDNVSWSNEGKTLTVDIKANNDLFTYSENNDYGITFTDLAGNTLTNYTITPIYQENDNSKISGYKYVINDINTQGINANITASVPSTSGNVYIYEANKSYKNTQYLIGVEEGSVPINKNIQILNDAKGIVKIYKTNNKEAETGVYYNDSYTNLCGSNASNNCLSDASFVIYAADEKTIIKEFMTDTDVVEINLPLGTYYIEEVDPPVGYELNGEKFKIVIENNNNVISVIVKNDPNKICIKKVSTTNPKTVLDGAKFSVQSMLGAVYEEFTSSSQEPIHCLEAQLPSGYYYIVENASPANYFKANVRYKVRVGNFKEDDIAEEIEYEDSEVVELELINNTAIIENKPGVGVTKTDITNAACVSGAELTVTDSNGNVVDKWISECVKDETGDKSKETHILNLEPGNYTLTESMAPVGYATAESIKFTIDEDGRASTSLDMKDDPIDVCILKTAKGIKGGLPDAEFEIYKENGELYDKFTSGTSCTSFAYMPIGNYIIKEIKAPVGYEIINEEIKITVKDTKETQIFEIENEVIAPKTSLDYSKYILIIASVFMMFGLGMVGYYAYKKQN